MVFILGREGKGQSPFFRELDNGHVHVVLAMAPLAVYAMNRKLQPHSTIPFSN